MNMELQFHVVKQSIKRTDGNAPVSDSVNYLTAEFNFESSDWDNTVKTATFRSGTTVYTVILDEHNKCLVPWEMVNAGKLKVSVYGDGANEYRITADTVDVPVYASGFSLGEESQHPTPTQYEQLTGIISTKSTVVANPADEPVNALTKIEVDGNTYSISGSGTEVIPNPETTTTESLVKIQIGDEVFNIPEGTEVEANPTLAGTESTLSGVEIDGVKYKTLAINDVTASADEVYSSEKVEDKLGDKLDADVATISGGGTNLFVLADSKQNWKPSTTGGSTYSDGASASGVNTTNLISAVKGSKFKMNFKPNGTYFRTFLYDSQQGYLSAISDITQDTDGYYYINLANASQSLAYICLIFTSTTTEFANLVVTDYDKFGNLKTVINDLYLSDTNVVMAKDRLGIHNILNGKKWCIGGDSFTAGGWESGEAPLIPSGKYAGQRAVYPYLIANRNNMTIQNLALGGRTLAKPSDGTFDNTFTDYYQTVSADANYLTLYFGINDSHHRPNAYGSDGEDTTGEIPLGTITDNTTATFYGAWNVILTWLITNRPNLHIGIIVSNGCETDDYRTATIAIAQKYGIPYIDLNGDERTPCMIRSTNASIASTIRDQRTLNWRISAENQHPNEACHLYESSIIEAFLRTL